MVDQIKEFARHAREDVSVSTVRDLQQLFDAAIVALIRKNCAA